MGYSTPCKYPAKRNTNSVDYPFYPFMVQDFLCCIQQLPIQGWPWLVWSNRFITFHRYMMKKKHVNKSSRRSDGGSLSAWCGNNGRIMSHLAHMEYESRFPSFSEWSLFYRKSLINMFLINYMVSTVPNHKPLLVGMDIHYYFVYSPSCFKTYHCGL